MQTQGVSPGEPAFLDARLHAGHVSGQLRLAVINDPETLGLGTIMNGMRTQYPTITMVLQLKGVRQFAVDAVDIGDEIFERNGPRLGKVTGVRSEGYKDTLDLNNGTQGFADVEGRYTLFITVEGMGRVDGEGRFINGTRFVAVGSEIKIKSQKIMGDASVYEISDRE